MKIAIQALFLSLLLHFVYIAGVLITGYIQTQNYKPDMAKSWENVDMLQNEIAFGIIGSPLVLIYTFIGITLIFGLVLYSYRKVKDAY